jgi:hypothetical protein
MRRRAFLTTVWVGLLAGCSDQRAKDPRSTTETTYGYGGSTTQQTVADNTTGTASATTTAATSATTTQAASEQDDYGEQRYGTHEYGG